MKYTFFRDFNILKRLGRDKDVDANSEDKIVKSFDTLRDAIRFAKNNCYTSIADCSADECETMWVINENIKENTLKITKSELKEMICEAVRDALRARDDLDADRDDKVEKAKRDFDKTRDDADSDRDYKLKKAGLKEDIDDEDEENDFEEYEDETDYLDDDEYFEDHEQIDTDVITDDDEDYVRFTQKMYGDFVSSYDGETPLEGLCYCVAHKDDDDGYFWRCFTADQWRKLRGLGRAEIYKKYPAAK